MNAWKFISITLILTLCGCSTVRNPQIYGYDRIRSIKTAYVVKNDASTRNVELYVQKALARKGIKTSCGPLSGKPDSVDVYVRYVDRWKWDITMYLHSLDVSIYDNKTNELLATGKFQNSWLHTWPEPDGKTQQVIDSIFANNQF